MVGEEQPVPNEVDDMVLNIECLELWDPVACALT